MSLSFRHLGWSTVALLALVGCDAPVSGPATPASPSTTPAGTGTDKNEIKSLPVEPASPAKGASATEAKLSDEELAAIKKLPAAEQPVALAQMTCPVSGDNLGSMNKPVKQVVDGKTFYLCCESCEEKVKTDPAAVLAKLKK